MSFDTPFTEVSNRAWAQELQASVADYMDMLVLGVQESGETIETVTSALYCGCDTCYWREVLAYLTPRIIEGYDMGYVYKNGKKQSI